MPAAIPVALAVGASAAGAGAAAGGVTIAGIALSSTALTAISVGLSVAGGLAQTLLAETPDKPKMQDGDASIKQAKPPRTRLYGRQRLGGVFMYYDSNPDGDLNTLLHHASHLCDELEEHWLNDKLIQIDGSGNVTADPWDNGGNPVVTIVNYLGDPDQSVTTLPDPPWTVDHRARGLCCTRIKYSDLKDEEQVKVFPSGPPPYRAVLRGALVYDPRKETPAGTQDITDEATWEWSDNAALVVLDYLTRFDAVDESVVGIVKIPVGFGIDLATQINLASFAAAADVCDEEIERKDPLDPPEPRWRSWGAYDLTEDRKSVLSDLLDTCSGQLIQGPDGKIGLSVGAPDPVAAVTLTGNAGSDQLLSWELAQGKNAIERVNVVKASYVSQIWEWAETEAGIQQDQDSIDRNGEQSAEVKLRFVPAESQAQRVAKSVLKRGNPTWSGTIKGTLALLDAWGERWIRLVIDELEIDQVFEISGIRLDRTNMTVEATVSSYDGWWDWDAATDEQDPAVFPPNTDEGSEVPIPENVIVTVEHRPLNNGTLAAVGVISWDPAPRSVYVGRARFRPTTPPDAAWQERKAEQDELSVETDPLIDGQQYEAQAKFIGPRGSPSDWSASTLFTAVADPVAPAVPVSISATPAGSTIVLSATAANSSNQRLIRFWRDSDATFAGAVNVGGAIWTGPNGTAAYTDAPGPGVWRYWATAGNWSGIESAATGPTSPVTFTPAAPVIVSPTTPYVTNDNTPTFSGTAPNGTTVHLLDGMTDVGSIAVVAGAWSITASTLADGTRNVTAIAVAPGPVSSVASNTVVTTIDTVSAVPVITTSSPINTTDTTPDISGTSENGAAISVYRGGSTLAGTATADGSGNWTATLGTLAVGTYSLTAKAVDALGNPQSAASSPAKTLNVNPLAPAITTSTGAVGNTNPPVAGTSTPSASIGVYADGVLNQTVSADGSGNWTATLAGLTAGARSITARQTVAGLTSADSTAITLTVQWNDPTADAHADFKNNRGWLLGSTAALTAIFGTITTSAQFVTMANGQLKATAANALMLSDLGLEYWEGRTNRCANRNAKPTDLTGVALSGDAAAVLTRVDDSATMVGSSILALLLASADINGFVFKLDNSAGVADAFATIGGTVSVTGACNGSVVYRGSAGRVEIGGATAVSFGASTPYVRVNGQRTAAATSEQMRIVAPAGATIWFILNQLESSAVYPTSPIVVNAAAANRLAPVITRTLSTDFDATQGFAGMRASVPANIAINGVLARFDTPDTTHTHFVQATTNTSVLGVTTNVSGQASPQKVIGMTTVRTVLHGWALNDFAITVDGTAAVTDASGTVPSTSTPVLKIAPSGSGVIEQFKWAALKPSNATLQAKSGWTVL